MIIKMLSAYLIQKYGVNPNKRLITSVDQYRLYKDFDGYTIDLKNFYELNKDNLNDIEKYIINLELNPIRKIMYLISQTHMSNYFGDISFLLENEKMSDVAK